MRSIFQYPSILSYQQLVTGSLKYLVILKGSVSKLAADVLFYDVLAFSIVIFNLTIELVFVTVKLIS